MPVNAQKRVCIQVYITITNYIQLLLELLRNYYETITDRGDTEENLRIKY